jgi:hypothetical protein
VVKAETEGRAGRDPGQPARTRECKLGAIFTQTAGDDQGRPVRDAGSTTYVGAIETAEEFGLRLYTEAWKRGWDRASIRVVMGDGSHWIWNIADQHFPGAIQIVDLYHAREHLWDLARKLFPADGAAQKRWLMHKLDWLEDGKIEKLTAALAGWQTPAPTLSWLRRSGSKPNISTTTGTACAIPNSAKRTCSSALA